MHRPRLRFAILLVAVALAVLALAAPASAHVTVNPAQATQGGYAKLTFRVPTETDNASTTKLQVFFPTDAPVASVLVKPHPGWSYRVVTKKLAKPAKTAQGDITSAVSQVVWRADSAGSAIKPGQFEEFDISLGPLPKVKSMEFKTLQTYSNGEVVRWIQSRTAGSAEPEHPAPTLQLLPASASGSTDTAAADTSQHAASGGGSGSGWALGVAIAALVVALAAVGLSLTRRRT